MFPPSRDLRNPSSLTLLRAVIERRIIPAPLTDPASPWTAERTFTIDPPGVGEARRWALSLTPDTCTARDELAVVLSELLSNVAVHAGGGKATITLSHTHDGLTGSITHHLPPANEPPDIPTPITAEISHLLDLDGPPDDELIATLAENGRGLFTVATLTAGTLHTHHDDHSTTTQWTHDSCRCPSRTLTEETP